MGRQKAPKPPLRLKPWMPQGKDAPSVCFQDSAGIQVTPLTPTPAELARDYLRVHKGSAGRIGIFNRSHYEELVTVQVFCYLLRLKTFRL